MSQVAALIEQVYPGRVPRNVQMLLMLTRESETYLVVSLDRRISGFVSSGSVIGQLLPVPEGFLPELDFDGGVIVTDRLELSSPINVTPEEVNQDPGKYALQRLAMDADYILASVRLKDAPPGLDHIGFGQLTRNLGSGATDDYLPVVDLYNTHTQLRVARLTGVVLYPTPGVESLLRKVYRFSQQDVRDSLDRPSLFYESLEDDPSQLLKIRDLVANLNHYHGEAVSVQGLALGGLLDTEELPPLGNLPVQVQVEGVGAADLTGVMPIFGLSSEEGTNILFGNYRFDLSVYRFSGGPAFAFLLSQQAILLDPIGDVERAEFGDPVRLNLAGYGVVNPPDIPVSDGLILQEIDLLVPTDLDKPLIVTRDPGLNTGDYLTRITLDGYLISSSLLGLEQYGARVIVVKSGALSYQKGSPPSPNPIPTAIPLPPPCPPEPLPKIPGCVEP